MQDMRSGNDKLMIATETGNKVLNPLENHADLYDKGYYNTLTAAFEKMRTRSVVVTNTKELIEIKW
jgi:hypothetical protein